jgi:hypothetical protein
MKEETIITVVGWLIILAVMTMIFYEMFNVKF